MNYLRLCLWKANDIRQRKNEIEHFLISNKLDIILISETYMTSKSLLNMNGYLFYDLKDPRERSCGGSAVLIPPRIKHYQMSSDLCE